MIRTATALSLGLLIATTAGCGRLADSRINPFNWFGASRSAPAPAAPVDADARLLMPQVTKLVVEKMPTGVIVRATGVPPTQGWWKAELVPDDFGIPKDGVLTYRFRIWNPPAPTDASTVRSREITAAAYISTPKLAEISKIVVVGETNQMETRR